MHGKLYMNIPYADKDKAKSLGAKWDGDLKKWYYQGAVEDYLKFAGWIAGGSEIATIAFEYLHILEGTRTCFRCGKDTTVVALGVGEHAVIYLNDEDKYEIAVREDLVGVGECVHLAWVDSEEDIPPALLKYLKAHYNVKTGVSKIAGECFANHCQHCGVIQGNNYVMDEVDSPLDCGIPDGPELKERLGKLKVKMFSIDENLQLNWDLRYCDNDNLYLRYGKVEEIIIAPSGEDWISYKEMYEL